MPDDPKPERCVSCDICTKGTSFAGVHCRCGADLTHATHVWLDANGAPIRHSGVPDAPPEQARATGKRWTLHVCGVCYEAKPEPFRDHSHLGIKWEDQWTAFVPAADLAQAEATISTLRDMVRDRNYSDICPWCHQRQKDFRMTDEDIDANRCKANAPGYCYARARAEQAEKGQAFWKDRGDSLERDLAQAEKERDEAIRANVKLLGAKPASEVFDLLDRAEQAERELQSLICSDYCGSKGHTKRCVELSARLDREKGKP